VTTDTSWVISARAYQTLDGQPRVALSGADMTLRVADGTTHKQIKRATGHTRPVFALAVFELPLPDGPVLRIATASWDRHVKIWEEHDLTCLHTLGVFNGHHMDCVSVVAYQYRDARDEPVVRVASGDDGGVLIIWDPATGDLVHKATNHRGRIHSIK
jgi:WD40 repeat protein